MIACEHPSGVVIHTQWLMHVFSADCRTYITTELDEQQASTMLKLIDTLEDNDDVQNVSSNFEVSDEVMEKLSA